MLFATLIVYKDSPVSSDKRATSIAAALKNTLKVLTNGVGTTVLMMLDDKLVQPKKEEGAGG